MHAKAQGCERAWRVATNGKDAGMGGRAWERRGTRLAERWMRPAADCSYSTIILSSPSDTDSNT